MADADTRYKRASATALLLPFMYTCHTDGVADVDADERVFVTWMYMGIAIATVILAAGIVTAAFTSKSPGATFTGRSPGATFTGKSPGVTWSN